MVCWWRLSRPELLLEENQHSGADHQAALFFYRFPLCSIFNYSMWPFFYLFSLPISSCIHSSYPRGLYRVQSPTHFLQKDGRLYGRRIVNNRTFVCWVVRQNQVDFIQRVNVSSSKSMFYSTSVVFSLLHKANLSFK